MTFLAKNSSSLLDDRGSARIAARRVSALGVFDGIWGPADGCGQPRRIGGLRRWGGGEGATAPTSRRSPIIRWRTLRRAVCFHPTSRIGWSWRNRPLGKHAKTRNARRADITIG